jgi:2,3-bisphosphoglycerate-dependent phosphoglycerate mutase
MSIGMARAGERRLYLIRHGKADHRSSAHTETSRGRTADPPLDERGLEQARLLTERLLRLPAPAGVYSSALTRARQTVAPWSAATETDVPAIDDLNEWFGGAWEFKEFEDLFAEHPEVPDLVRFQEPIWHLAPGGEAFETFQDRVVRTVEELLERHPQGDLWIVCHGGVINAYAAWVLRIADQDMFFLPENTSLNTFRVRGTERSVWFLSDTLHLTSPELFART